MRLLAADYSQIELRILAHVTQEPRLVEAFRSDQDIHRATASDLFGVAIEAVNPSHYAFWHPTGTAATIPSSRALSRPRESWTAGSPPARSTPRRTTTRVNASPRTGRRGDETAGVKGASPARPDVPGSGVTARDGERGRR